MSMCLFQSMSEPESSMKLLKTEQLLKLSMSKDCAVVEIVFVDAAAPVGVFLRCRKTARYLKSVDVVENCLCRLRLLKLFLSTSRFSSIYIHIH